MSNSTTLRVRDIIREHFGLDIDSVNLESRIVDDLGADSIDGVEVVMQVEDEFDIDIADTFVAITVADVVNAVEQALAKRKAS